MKSDSLNTRSRVWRLEPRNATCHGGTVLNKSEAPGVIHVLAEHVSPATRADHGCLQVHKFRGEKQVRESRMPENGRNGKVSRQGEVKSNRKKINGI